MIIKFRTMLPLLRAVVRPSFCQYFDPINSQDSAIFDKTLKIKDCKNVSEIIKISIQNSDLNDNQLSQIFKGIRKFKKEISPFWGSYFLSQKIKNIDLMTCEQSLIEDICNVIEYVTLDISNETTIVKKIYQRVEEQINNIGQFQNSRIFSYLNFAYSLKNISLIYSLLTQLEKRLPFLGHKDIMNYLSKLRRRSFPNKIQRQFFDKVAQKIMEESQICHLNNKIQFYVGLKKINTVFYRANNMINQLQKDIIQSIQQIDEQGLECLLTFKNELNVVLRHILSKIIHQICETNYEQSRPAMHAKNILSLFKQLLQFLPLRLDWRSKQKLMKYILHNIQNKNEIKRIISNKSFRTENIQELHKYIINNCPSLYISDYSYVYEVLMKGVRIEEQHLQQFLEQVASALPNKTKIQSFLKIGVIAHKLKKQGSLKWEQEKNIKNLDIIYNHFIKNIDQLIVNPENLKFLLRYYLNKNWLEQFNYSYRKQILTMFKNNLTTEKNAKTDFAIFMYLIFTNNSKQFFQKLQNNPEWLNNYKIKNILKKIIMFPKQFANSYGLIFQMLSEVTHVYSQKKLVMEMLCQSQIHMLLTSDQIYLFLKLAMHILQGQWQINHFPMIKEFIYSIVHSFQNSMRSNRNYRPFLSFVQEKFSSEPNILNPNFLMELLLSNAINPKIVQNLYAKGNYNGIIKTYLQICSKQFTKWGEISISKQTLPLILKANYIPMSFIEVKQQQIIMLINRSKLVQVQKYLMNFQLPSNPNTNRILNNLLLKYSSYLMQKTQRNERVDSIMLHLRDRITNETKQAYKCLLQSIQYSYECHLLDISQEMHELLLEECTKYEVNCYEYASKIINAITYKIIKRYYIKNIPINLVKYLVILQPQKCYKILSYLRFQSRLREKQQILMLLCWCLNPSNKLINRQIEYLLRDSINYNFSVGWQNMAYIGKKTDIFNHLLSQCKNNQQIKMNWLLKNLTTYLKNNRIYFSLSFKSNIKTIKMGNRLIIPVPSEYNQMFNNKYKSYYSEIFSIPPENIIIIYCIQYKNMEQTNALLLCKNLPKVFQMSQELFNALRYVKNQNENDLESQDQQMTLLRAMERADKIQDQFESDFIIEDKLQQ